MIQIVHEALQKEQKEISRSLSPHVQKQLRDVYIVSPCPVNVGSLVDGLFQRAMMERGRGSVARQKDVVNNGVQDARGDMFAGGSNILMSKLAIAAEVSANRSSKRIFQSELGLNFTPFRLSEKPSTPHCLNSLERSKS